MHVLRLSSLEQTALLGNALAKVLGRVNPEALLFYGGLGAGKTTLVRHMVERLPGGKDAEVASPSFTIANIYCTSPRVHHFDLYRLEPGRTEDSLEESLEDGSVLTIIEWAERLLPDQLPGDGVSCTLVSGPEENQRRARLTPLGPKGERFLGLLASAYPQE